MILYNVIDTHTGRSVYSTYDRTTANLVVSYCGSVRYAVRYSPI